MWSHVASRIGQLKSMSYSDLAALPSHSDIQESDGDKAFTLATWVDQEEDGTLQVGVYTDYTGFLGIGTSAHDGFLMATDGTIEEMPCEMQVKHI